MKAKAGAGVMWAQAKQWQEPPEAGGRKSDPTEPSERAQPRGPLGVGLWPPDLFQSHFLLFRPAGDKLFQPPQDTNSQAVNPTPNQPGRPCMRFVWHQIRNSGIKLYIHPLTLYY